MYAEMRKMWLNLAPQPNVGEEVYCVAYDIGVERGAATVFASSDGSVSLYFSTGGGVLGAGGSERVRNAARDLLAAAERSRNLLRPASGTKLPPSGVYQVLTRMRAGTLTASLTLDELKAGTDKLLPLFRAADRVLTEIRLMKQEMDQSKQKPS